MSAQHGAPQQAVIRSLGHLESEVAQQTRLQLRGQAARAAVVADAAQELPARQALSDTASIPAFHQISILPAVCSQHNSNTKK